MRPAFVWVSIFATVLWASGPRACGQTPAGKAFSYQGRLTVGGGPANGVYDFEFRLYNAPVHGSQVGPTVTVDDLEVNAGLFTTTLDFGNVYDGNARWLEIAARSGASGKDYTKLSPRQELLSTPYASGLVLPLAAVVSSSNAALSVTNTGSGKAIHSGGRLWVDGMLHLGMSGSDSSWGLYQTDQLALNFQSRPCCPGVIQTCVTFTADGNVGIGTDAPQRRLHVTGQGPRILVEATGGSPEVNLKNSAGLVWAIYNHGSANYLGFYQNGNRMVIDEAGNVGIGTTNPQQRLHIVGENDHYDLALGGAVGRINTDPNLPSSDLILSSNRHVDIRLDNDGGEVGEFRIKNSGAQEVVKVTEDGKFTLSSNGAPVVEMGAGLDYAEGFDVVGEDAIGPGTVLVIDPDHPGKLAISHQAYDRKVAGIVAGARNLGSGVRLGAGRFDHDVALAGRVYCNVDATHAAVQPGDLLTTSATPGHAMVVTDPARAQGAILGKAMERLEKGKKGQILVLATLQ